MVRFSVIDLTQIKKFNHLRLEFFFLRPDIRRDEFEVVGLLPSLLIALTLEPLLPRGDKEGSFESLRSLEGLF